VGAALARALAGHLEAASALLKAGDNTDRRRFDVDGASALVTAAGLTVEAVAGVRVVADLIPGALAATDPAGMLDFELAASPVSPWRGTATQLHLLARRGTD